MKLKKFELKTIDNTHSIVGGSDCENDSLTNTKTYRTFMGIIVETGTKVDTVKDPCN